MSETDMELLGRYTGHQAEDAFGEIVHRHLALVYSAALRQVRSPQLAEEVAQSVFTDLARQARQLAPSTILSAWLYRVTHCKAVDVVRREARRQAREQAAYALTTMNASAESNPHSLEPEADWTQIGPLLDEAMHALPEADRSALLLRYFENKSLQEVGQVLGTTEEAARKRISRAIDRLRTGLGRRGIAVGAGGLAAVISSHAIQAAPLALDSAICASTALAGTAVAGAGTTATLNQAIAMTTLQKVCVTAAIVASVSAGVYQACQSARLRAENEALRQELAPQSRQLQQLQGERDQSAQQIAALRQELANRKSNSQTAELMQLRGRVGSLRQELSANEAKTAATPHGMAAMINDPSLKVLLQQAGEVLAPDQEAALNTFLTNAVNTRQIQAAAWGQKH